MINYSIIHFLFFKYNLPNTLPKPFKKTFYPVFVDGVQLFQDQRATMRRQFSLTTKLPGAPGTPFINLGKIKDWINLGATQWR